MKALLPSLAITGLILSAVSCGKSNDDAAAAATVFGTLKTSLLASTDITSTSLTAATCVSNADSGLFTATFTGDAGTRMAIKIKGFTTTPQTYTCTQAPDNKVDGVGQKYNVCAVDFSLHDSVTGINSYNMFRDLATDKALNYNGSCTVTTTYAAPKVTITVNCANLIQTIFQGSPRNPIDPAVTASVNSATSVSCNI